MEFDLDQAVKEAQERVAQRIEELAASAMSEISADVRVLEKDLFDRFEKVKADFNLSMTEEDYEEQKAEIEAKWEESTLPWYEKFALKAEDLANLDKKYEWLQQS